MCGDVLAMKKTCSGGDGCGCRTCGPTRKLTRDVLTSLRETFASPNFRRSIGEASGKIQGLIGATSANVKDISATVGDHSAMRRGVMVMS